MTEFSPYGGWLGTVAIDGVLQIGEVRSEGTSRCLGDPDRIRPTGDTTPLINPDHPITLAVMGLAPLQVPPDVSEAVAEILRNQISGAKNVVLVERQRLEDLKRELGIQYSDLADPATAVRLGRAAGARKMIFGSLSRLGTTYTITVRMVDVETGTIDGFRGVECLECREEDLPAAAAALKEPLVGFGR